MCVYIHLAYRANHIALACSENQLHTFSVSRCIPVWAREPSLQNAYPLRPWRSLPSPRRYDGPQGREDSGEVPLGGATVFTSGFLG